MLKTESQITPIQIDVYFNFSHPKGSVSPIDLMQDARWNLCPMEIDELIGPMKIFHGSDCYYEVRPDAIRLRFRIIYRAVEMVSHCRHSVSSAVNRVKRYIL